MKLLTIIGTRPEAVKMAPVLRALASRPEVTSLLAVTGQHPDLVMEPLRFFELTPDIDLGLHGAGQEPVAYVARATERISRLLDAVRPDRVVVQGDTASAKAAAQAAWQHRIPVAHVEAGLRTHAAVPWPEEPFRVAIDAIADLLFAPTPLAAANLRREAVAGMVHVTGNSGIDALDAVLRALAADAALSRRCDDAVQIGKGRPFILVTLHRRENVGPGAAELCAALRELDEAGAAEIVFPLHPNPDLNGPVRAALSECRHIRLLKPQSFVLMVRLMQRSDLIVTDSGGIQEEAPSLGKPVLVLRDQTERPEGIAAGAATLTGASRGAIIAGVEAALAGRHVRLSANPYGDGKAAGRIVAALLGEPYAPFGDAPRPVIPAAVGG